MNSTAVVRDGFHRAVISELVRWIDANLHQPLNIDTVAARVGFTRWHLQRLFKHYTGFALAGYILCRRLTAAAQLLQITRKSIAEISQIYCFDSQQTFARCFKKVFGITPGGYRRQSFINQGSTL